jgi:hypothetical protein
LGTSLPKIQLSAFSASTERSGTELLLRLQGNADTEAVPELASYLRAVHVTATGLGATDVVVDFHDLYFMTSSCFKCFLTWISAIEELEAPRRYKVRLEANANLHWQQRSFAALCSFAASLVTCTAAGTWRSRDVPPT